MYQLPSDFQPISLQDIFDKAWDHFIENDGMFALAERRVDDLAPICSYLNEQGHKCAVGLVLPDGHPAQRATFAFPFLVHEYPELWADDVKSASHWTLLKFQQSLHDSLINRVDGEWKYTKEERKEEYLRVAREYNLAVPGKA